MKQFPNIKSTNIHLRQVWFAPLCGLLMFLPIGLFSQDADTVIVDSEPVAEESMISPSLDFVTVQKSDNSIELRTELKAKINGSFKKLPFLKVTFFNLFGDSEKNLGYAITNHEGKAVFNVKQGTYAPNSEGSYTFKVIFAGNKVMETTEEELTIVKAMITIDAEKEDSLGNIKVMLAETTGTLTIPLPDAVIGIYVKRHFKPLKLGEITTDENGEGLLEIPENLPGDAQGNLLLTAMVEDDEVHGIVEASISAPWGTKVAAGTHKLPRSLWSSHPPIWMIVTFIILMVTVWGHYLVIIYELFRLRKEDTVHSA